MTTKTKFKNGDVVRCIAEDGSYGRSYRYGETYEVLGDEYGGHICTVVDSNGCTSNGWSAQNFTLVRKPKKSNMEKVAEYQAANCSGALPGAVVNVDYKPSAIETQVGGTHYTDMAIQPAHYNLANGMGWAEGDAISYISRWRAKGGLQDLRKARQTLLLLIEHEEALGTK